MKVHLLAILVASAFLFPSRDVCADDEPSSRAPSGTENADPRAANADRLFQEGLELMKSDRCTEAIPKFQDSAQLDAGAATLLNLATCYVRVGKTGSAWRAYRAAAEMAASENSEDLREQAFKAMLILTPRLTQLIIVAPAGGGNAISLRLNGMPLSIDGSPIAVDPGENVLEATAKGRETWRRVVKVNELGATIVIEVPELAPLGEPAATTPGRRKWGTAALILGGAGLAGIAAGSIFGVSAIVSNSDAKANCRGDRCNPTGRSDRDAADHRATIANVLVGAGAVIAVSGAVLWFTSPRDDLPAVGVSPWLPSGIGSLGIAVRGSL